MANFALILLSGFSSRACQSHRPLDGNCELELQNHHFDLCYDFLVSTTHV
jgi:hypothetical protein